jgi:D-xylose transport system permease protein
MSQSSGSGGASDDVTAGAAGAATTPGAATAAVDDVAISDQDLVAAAPELLADSLGEYAAASWRRVKNGESGALPIIAGLIVIVIAFQVDQSKFLSAGNIVNLLVQGAFFILLGLGELFALLLSEIDLSVGFSGAVGATIMAGLMSEPTNWPWWAAVIIGLLSSAALGLFQGILITRLHIPSFVVTLGGLLGFGGLLIFIFDSFPGAVGGVLSISNSPVIYNLVNGTMSATASWIMRVAAVAVFGFFMISRNIRRRATGLTTPPVSVAILTVAVAAAAGVLLVIVCNINRGNLVALSGVPWVIPLVLLIIVGWTWFLGRTRTGRYIYAIGASPEAARRAGINVARIRVIAFTLSSFTACLAAIVYASRLGSISVGFDGGTYVLYAVAVAVIGGASLFGGRGKAIHALLGGVVIAAVYNGLALIGISTAGTQMATAAVLILAVMVDSLVRRRGSTSV